MLKPRASDYDQQEVESESPIYSPLLVDKAPEINAEEVQIASPSRNAHHTLPSRQVRTLKSEYPLSYQYRSNSVAISKITLKRRAGKVKAESVFNINSEKGVVDESSL